MNNLLKSFEHLSVKKRNYANQLKMIVLNTLFATSILWAGQNGSAKLYIDTDISTPIIDSVKTCNRDSNFTVSVNITDAVELYDFQLYLQFDTSRLQFVSAAQGNSTTPNFLESKGGQIFYTKKISKDDSTKILLAGTITGDAKSECAIGSGILALVTFKMKSTDSTILTLRDPVFQDFSETVDTTLQRHSAKIIYGNSSIRFNKKQGKHLSKIILTGKKLQISLSDKSRSQIELVDING